MAYDVKYASPYLLRARIQLLYLWPFWREKFLRGIGLSFSLQFSDVWQRTPSRFPVEHMSFLGTSENHPKSKRFQHEILGRYSETHWWYDLPNSCDLPQVCLPLSARRIVSDQSKVLEKANDFERCPANFQYVQKNHLTSTVHKCIS